MNYCAGCHSAQVTFVLIRIGRDLNLSEDQLIQNLMFNADKTFETIESDDATWMMRLAGLDRPPPDLSLTGEGQAEPITFTTFLKGFYLDPR